MSGVYTREQVASHDKENDCWIVVDGDVYDVTKFLPMHPGGKSVLADYAGKDATEVFFSLHRADVLRKYQRLIIGRLADSKERKYKWAPGDISAVPYGESSAWQGFKSPYYNESHMKLRTAIRKFYDEEICPNALQMDEMGKTPPKEIYQKLGKAGILACRIGPGEHLKATGYPLPGGVKPEEFDFFHELIAHEENARVGLSGYQDGLGAGLVIGLPPVIHFGSKELKNKIVPEVLRGDKVICLAISEPFAGSDVANIQCRATKTPDGQHYIVSGVKKWITNGTFADYFVTAVRTGGKSYGGVSLLLIERSPGVDTQPIKTSYSAAAGTALVTLENVKVPVTNLLGKENQGFACIMANFNHERWLIVCGAHRYTRLIVEESFKWANQRKVFNQPLISQPVIREKLGHMFAQVESVQNWLENITYQMTKMNYAEQTRYLAGPIALLKLQCTRVSYTVSDMACQIFGGRAITRTGMGVILERFQRSLKFGAILGGSEEIMADLGVRQAMKYYPPHARL